MNLLQKLSQKMFKPKPAKIARQARIILGYLKEGNTVTTLDAVRLFGTTKLTTRISELRSVGHKIMHTVETDGQKRWNRYYMELDA